MKTKEIITVIGSSNIDLVALSPRIPVSGETILGTDFFMVPGGKGANQAVAAAKLGAKVFFVAKLGKDMYGAQSLENFEKSGIDTKYITRTDESPSGTALITVDEKGNNSIVVVPGANHRLTVEDVKCVEKEIQSSGVVVCQLEIPLEVVEYASELSKKHNVPFILNPAPAPQNRLLGKLLKKTSILTPNETEAEIITGVKVESKNSALKACRHILDLGVETVILTMGSNGSLLVTEKNELFIPSIKVNAVDTTAAGDAFTGGLAYLIAQGNTILEAAVFANYVAALSVTKKGAQSSMPTLEAVKQFMDGYKEKNCFIA